MRNVVKMYNVFVLRLGVHRIQNYAIWPDPDPTCRDPAWIRNGS